MERFQEVWVWVGGMVHSFVSFTLPRVFKRQTYQEQRHTLCYIHTKAEPKHHFD